MVFADPGICNVRSWNLGGAELFFLTLHLADDIGVIEDPCDLSVQEFVAQKNPNPTNTTFRKIC